MGVSITANHSRYHFDMGYGGFYNLRKNIALALNEEFGRHYATLLQCHTTAQYQQHDRMSEAIIEKYHLDTHFKDVLDFLYMDDCSGVISHTACKQILDLIRDIDYTGKGFQYVQFQNDDYGQLKSFLAECYSKRRKMRWS